MRKYMPALQNVFLAFLIGGTALLMAGCGHGYQIGQAIPVELGGAPNTIPPPAGTPAYDAWLNKPGPNPKR